MPEPVGKISTFVHPSLLGHGDDLYMHLQTCPKWFRWSAWVACQIIERGNEDVHQAHDHCDSSLQYSQERGNEDIYQAHDHCDSSLQCFQEHHMSSLWLSCQQFAAALTLHRGLIRQDWQLVGYSLSPMGGYCWLATWLLGVIARRAKH